jgi:DNA-binding PadR family transcriptional regulator
MNTHTLDKDGIPPLSSLTLQILLVLAKRPAHGYGIAQWCAQESNDAVMPRSSTLYAALSRLMRDGLIEEYGRTPGAGSLNERKIYQLTSTGMVVLEREIVRLKDIVELATGRVKP